MKLKPVTLSVAFVLLMITCACLLSNPANTKSARSSLNAKFEYPEYSSRLKETATQSEPTPVRNTITFPNAKREKI